MENFNELYQEYYKECDCIYPSPDEGDHLNYDPKFVKFCEDRELDEDKFAERVKQREGWGDYDED
jgi:hypothetical protein|tara:strand:+ start:124 stop:318 length:195 start_codon:yes stop_codon:yes gene_type:complete